MVSRRKQIFLKILSMVYRKRMKWSQGPPTKAKRDSCRLAVVEDHVYAIGKQNHVVVNIFPDFECRWS